MWRQKFLKFVYSKIYGKSILNMTSLDTIQKLESRAMEAENIISVLKKEVSELQKAADFCHQNIQRINAKKFEEIQCENEKLRKEVEQWKFRLVEAEKKLGIEPVLVNLLSKTVDPPLEVSSSETQSPGVVGKKKKEMAKTVGDEKRGENKLSGAAGDESPVDVRRLDIRVGKITNVKKHSDADTLYVEEVDLGEAKPRVVVSGLVKYVPIEEMENRMVVALCNLKPAKMRGVTSEAMVLCASTPEKVEILCPPEGSCPGDRVIFEGFSGEPDPVLNPKKKIFETVAPDLKTDNQRRATYKGVPFMIPGKGVVTSQTLIGVQIK